jgi:hypothetical protein
MLTSISLLKVSGKFLTTAQVSLASRSLALSFKRKFSNLGKH